MPQKNGKPLLEADGLSAVSNPVQVHADELDYGGLDLASLVHQNAKTLCRRLGEPCGCQANLPEGLCIADMSPCLFAPEGGSGKDYASDAAKAAAGADTGKKR